MNLYSIFIAVLFLTIGIIADDQNNDDLSISSEEIKHSVKISKSNSTDSDESSSLNNSSEEKDSKPKVTDLDAKAFIKRCEKTLSLIQNKNAHLPEGILKDGVDLSENYQLLLDLDDIAEEIKNMSSTAKDYLQYDFQDVSIKPALSQLRRAGGIYAFGSHMAQMDLNVKNLNETFHAENIQSYDDDDIMYSQSDIIELGITRDSENVEELKYYWKQWVSNLDTDSTAEYLSDVISRFKKEADNISLKVPELLYNGYSLDFVKNIDEVMKKLTPFYQKLHAYVRSKLFKKYGAGVLKPNGPIPIHLYEKLKQQHWRLDEDISVDFNKENLPNFDELLENQNFVVENITEIAENFYETIGFDNLNVEFWEQNIIEGTNDCASDEELGTVFDKIPNATLTNCKNATINFDAFTKYHIYFGKLHNALLKKELPVYFFPNYYLGHAVGSAVSLSATSVKHLNTIGLIDDLDSQSSESTLMRHLIMALETMNGIFSAYVQAEVMIGYQNDKIKYSAINAYYWKMLGEHNGVEPPIDRPEDAIDIPYDYYMKFNKNEDILEPFAGEILGYQFYLALCQKIGYTGPLHDCDFYNNTAVGPVLRDMLKLGSSKPFSEVIAILSPELKQLDANGILTFYEPVQKWLTQHIKSKNITVGWNQSTKNLSKDKYNTKLSAKRFVKKSSKRIYELYDQISADLFANQDKADEFNQEDENVFWKISNSAVAATELKEISLQAKKIDIKRLKNRELEKQVTALTKIGDLFVLGEELTEFLEHKKSVVEIATAKNIPAYPGKDTTNVTLSYMPDIINIFINSTDNEVLQYYWETWREVNANWSKNQLSSMVESFQKAADILDLSLTEFWYRNYDTDFINQMEKVITDLQPFYLQLHHYIRSRLVERYNISCTDAIPHHLYQQVLLQTWTNNSVIEAVFPAKNLPAYEKFIPNEKYDTKRRLKFADEFYSSLGFDDLAEDFWQNRLKPQAEEQKSACKDTIYDKTPKVYMRYCESVDFRKFLQAHGYLGRIHYAVEKNKLPAYYFDSYFLEYPVGEAIILSASSPKHLQLWGVEFDFTNDVLMNRLLRMGIHTLFNIHMHFVHTKVVNDYLDGTILEKDIVKHYWTLMIKYAGVEPPSDRKQDTFDFPYEFYTDLEQNHQVKKFVSEVLGYQFYDALCKLSSHEGDLSNCDIFGSKAAGDSLKKMMQFGSRAPWKTVLKTLLPENPELNADAILKYYKPLQDWLEKANNDTDTFDEEVENGLGSTKKKFLRPENFIDEDDD